MKDWVYIIDGVLYSHEPNSKVDMYLFSLVERRRTFSSTFFVGSPFGGYFLEWTKIWSISEAFT